MLSAIPESQDETLRCITRLCSEPEGVNGELAPLGNSAPESSDSDLYNFRTVQFADPFLLASPENTLWYPDLPRSAPPFVIGVGLLLPVLAAVGWGELCSHSEPFLRAVTLVNTTFFLDDSCFATFFQELPIPKMLFLPNIITPLCWKWGLLLLFGFSIQLSPCTQPCTLATCSTEYFFS